MIYSVDFDCPKCGEHVTSVEALTLRGETIYDGVLSSTEPDKVLWWDFNSCDHSATRITHESGVWTVES